MLPREYPGVVIDTIDKSNLPQFYQDELREFLEGTLDALYDIAHGRGVKWVKGIDGYCTANNAVADYFNKGISNAVH